MLSFDTAYHFQRYVTVDAWHHDVQTDGIVRLAALQGSPKAFDGSFAILGDVAVAMFRENVQQQLSIHLVIVDDQVSHLPGRRLIETIGLVVD